MTGKVVNLKRARKSRARTEARAKADANAAKHGRSRAKKILDATISDKAVRSLDGHKRDDR